MRFTTALVATAALVAYTGGSAVANESKATNVYRSGVESEWRGGNSRTTVDTVINRQGSFSGHSTSYEGTTAVKIDADRSSLWLMQDGSVKADAHSSDALLFSTTTKSSTSADAYDYTEDFTQNAHTVINTHDEYDYSGYVTEVEASTEAY